MQSHRDDEHRPSEIQKFLSRLKERADETVKQAASQITAGKSGEKPIAEWEASGVHVKQLPDDEQGILRISTGGINHPTGGDFAYCVFRGRKEECIDLLRKALKALKKQ